MTEPLLRVEDLSMTIGGAPVVEEVSFELGKGEMLGLVGESGCGKTVTALSIMRLFPEPPGRIVGGRILFRGENLLEKDEAALRGIRGDRIGMIFQEPMTSLNPVFTIGDQIEEAVLLHRAVGRAAARRRAVELLDLVGIPSPARTLERYPHQLSGGQRQRVMIAIALANEPDLLVADEPTTALDVTVQAQILDLIQDLRARLGMAVLLITHDLGVVAEFCDRVAVMYAGQIVETAPAADLFRRPRHRYTQALLDTIPAANPPGRPLPTIAGQVPPPGQRPTGCHFTPRCFAAVAPCPVVLPEFEGGEHKVRCWNPAA
ncbi:MAG TPA: ABC transporter ATP-binding protein [Microvirga sp.]|nr:ABC transporter ATP-binding protein [Microvirga sp.]